VRSRSGDANDHPDAASFEAALGRSAFELPATRSSLRRSEIFVALLVAAAIGLLVLGGVLRWRQYELTSLASTGRVTTATVESVDTHTVGREHHIIGDVTVRYTVDGQARSARFDVSNHVLRYHDGDLVPLAYDPQQVGRVDLVDEPAASQGLLPWEIPTAFAVMAGLMGAIAVRHLRSQRRLLKANEWLAVPAVLRPSTRRLRGRGTTVVELGEAASPERVVATPIGIRALPPTVEPLAWVAGWGGRRFVLAPEGGRPLLLMHRLSDVGVDAAPIDVDGLDDVSPRNHQRHAP
jgi:hypothetical protein